MSEKYHEIADCPKCGKRDLVEQTEQKWVCLGCGFSKDLSHPETESEAGSAIGGMWIFVLLGTLIWMVLML
jgi:ribosomal protein L37AE/L43A